MAQTKTPDPAQQDKTAEIPGILPILPIRSLALFPGIILPVTIRDSQAFGLIDDAMAENRLIGMLLSKSPEQEGPHQGKDLYQVGTVALILKMAKSENKGIQMLVQGMRRFRVLEYVSESPYLKARIESIVDTSDKDMEVEAGMRNLVSLFQHALEMSPQLPQELGPMSQSLEEPGMLADLVASSLNIKTEEKQGVLQTLDVKERLKTVNRLLNREIQVLELGQKIQSQVKQDMDKGQRDFYLRQQLKAIKEELGEKDEGKVEVEEFRTKLAEANLPEEARKEAERELSRLERMPPASAEYTVASTYLDWILSLPWNKSTEDVLDIKNARRVLDEDHYNLEKAKKRIVEYLAVKKLKPDSKGPILCFAGPPGTGKTSLAHSIARALGRKFARISLGGVRDEAEIRGHRRTYVGAMPGRIIQGIQRAGTNNPVFILDEIDKVGADFRGDPSAALLETLDPEQNNTFSDHYLDVPFDLSKVMFITTANILDTIPPALRDRMEVLRLSGYTEDEKVKIAKRYLLPRQLAANGLTENHLTLSDGAIRKAISGYTREAGLRNLERQIGTICRGVARKVAEQPRETERVTARDIERFLGPVQFYSEITERTSVPGVAAGLAWTEAGGDILFVEAAKMKGKQGLTLTGQLGDVMKESARAALSYIRSRAEELAIPPDAYEDQEIHIHVPAGAIPKDGPSAGITILTALVSLFTGTSVNSNTAMTGEITLRGQVLPVGGIKEKVLAAHRAGITRLILPKWNQKDVADIPGNIQKKMTFYFVKNMEEVIRIAFPGGRKG